MRNGGVGEHHGFRSFAFSAGRSVVVGNLPLRGPCERIVDLVVVKQEIVRLIAVENDLEVVEAPREEIIYHTVRGAHLRNSYLGNEEDGGGFIEQRRTHQVDSRSNIHHGKFIFSARDLHQLVDGFSGGRARRKIVWTRQHRQPR